MKAKNLITMVLAGAFSVSLLAGCGASKTTESSAASSAAQTETQSSTADTTAAESSEQAESNTEESAENTADKTNSETGKTLVVYYSASGNTERVAKAAAEAAGADLFEIVPVEPYTSDDLNWRNNDSRVSREHDDESLRDVELVSTEVENWDSYDTVLIGYPIWWGIAAWPTDGFVKANDFTGKTVIPFCTAASSGIGQSGKLLADLAGSGDWQEGQRFASGASDKEIAAWVAGLGLAK
ncbi:flavodoxin [Pilosibacter sp. HC1M1C21]|uniref:flavodoxin n=1 Tax=Pilosibacter sp. HC1M1C21 TaxID=3378803 RepID=UPI003859BFE2